MNMKRIKFLAALTVIAFVSLSFVGCGGDDKKDDGGSSGSSRPSQLIGYWFGYDTGNEGYWMVLNLGGNGYADFKCFKSNVSENYTLVDKTSLPWHYNSSKGHIFVFTEGNNGYAIPVLSIGGDYMTVSLSISSRDVKFSMERSSGGSSGGGGGSSGGGGGSSGTKCKYCQGNGECNNYTSLTGNKYHCHGSGKCQFCGGDGYTDGFGINNVLCPNCYGYKGSGKCSYCSGTGICSKCGGSGYQ